MSFVIHEAESNSSNLPGNTLTAGRSETTATTTLLPDGYDKFASAGFDPWGDYLFGSVMIFVGLSSLIGNGLAVIVFRRKRRNITVPEVLLLNIAIVDLFLAIASYPFTIIAAFSHRWVFGEIGCTLYGAVCYFLGLATILSLTALAVFRFVKTCFPNRGQWLTGPRTWTNIVLPIYLYSLIWTLIPLVFGVGGYDVEPFGLSCTLAWRDPDYAGKMYIVSVSVCCVFVPTVAIIVSHIGIFRAIRHAGKMFTNKGTGKQSNKAEIQFIRVSFGVCFGFLFAWLPYVGISLWSAFGDASSIPIWITPIPVLLAKSSIAYNPVIYVLTTRRYRVDFTKVARELLHLAGPSDQDADDFKTAAFKTSYRKTTVPLETGTKLKPTKTIEASNNEDEDGSEEIEMVIRVPAAAAAAAVTISQN